MRMTTMTMRMKKQEGMSASHKPRSSPQYMPPNEGLIMGHLE